MSNDLPARMVALWGASGVGKSSALSGYVTSYCPSWIDDDADTRGEQAKLREIWFKLLANQLIAGTTRPEQYTLRHRDGWSVIFRDMRGLDSENPRSADTAILHSAAAAVLFVELAPHDEVAHAKSVMNALAELGGKPTALAITKCESRLTQPQFDAFALNPLDGHYSSTLIKKIGSQLGVEAIFPITVYGWRRGLPAQYLDGFGRFVPVNVEPCLVDRPFDFVIGKLQRSLD